MSGTSTWTAETSATGYTELVTLFQDGAPLSFKQLFELLQENSDFVDWYTEQLKSSRYPSYFWEHPPLTRSTYESDVEFALVNAPMLRDLRPDPAPFRSYFVVGEVVTFRNLGGDAMLIAPSPGGSSGGYAHLAAFLHRAAQTEVRALWQSVGQLIRKSLTDKPIWLSTSGLGVAWLHIRLDSTPKYYQHRPYKLPPAAVNPAQSR